MPRIQGGVNNGSYFYIDYTIVSQDVAGNWTDVYWILGVHWGSYYFNIHDAAANMSTTVSGATAGGTTGSGVYNSGWPIPGAGTNRDKPFWDGTTRIFHNVSGQGNIRFIGSAWWDTPGNFTSSINTTISLPDIPRGPAAPSKPVLSNIGSTSIDVVFTDSTTPAAPIDSRQIGYGTNASTPTNTVSSDGSTTITGLTPGVKYYFWARTHNVAGYSPWSARSEATTLNVPDAPSTPVLSDTTPTSVKVTWTPNGTGGSPITSYQVGYNTTGTPPTSGSVATSPQTITGLTPGATYYFWVRARNAIGWGPWSGFASNTTIAGARIKVGAVWKYAVPYLNVGGVWKLVRPWIRTAGVWKEGI